MIQLYGVSNSRSNRPQWVLEELEVPYEFYQLDFTKGDNRSDFFLKINPAGKMPAMVDGDLTLTESGAICNYLGEKYPEKGLVPQGGTRDGALYDQWTQFVLTELEQPLWTTGKHRFALPEEWRVPAIFETAHKEFAKALELFRTGLGGNEFLVADRFTAADILAVHTLIWAIKFNFPVEDPVLLDYVERMKARPAFGRMYEKEKLTIPR